MGAGPGGLGAAMILAHHGYDVEIFEKVNCAGGRNAAIQLGKYNFDTGTTILLFLGATFNLGHNISPMLFMRLHNRFEEVKRCYLVGGGAHPGSGLPTIYESSRISAHLIRKDIN